MGRDAVKDRGACAQLRAAVVVGVVPQIHVPIVSSIARRRRARRAGLASDLAGHVVVVALLESVGKSLFYEVVIVRPALGSIPRAWRDHARAVRGVAGCFSKLRAASVSVPEGWIGATQETGIASPAAVALIVV
jgi:hypothetical protein